MSKKVCIFEYSEEEWQEYCRKHKSEWKAFGEKIKKIRIKLRLSKKRRSSVRYATDCWYFLCVLFCISVSYTTSVSRNLSPMTQVCQGTCPR